ncbi:MAG: hypothetical protein KAI47_22875, partial [Deltaproteobacteria bacterium]|nr:hypothetical protein [Deltaproteobacteria bacterium]
TDISSSSMASRGLGLLVALTTCLIAVAPARGDTLVNCKEKRFQRFGTARSLFLWTKDAEAAIRKAKKNGVYGLPPEKTRSNGISSAYCPKVISYRGTAHCKEPQNPAYRAGLASIIAVCRQAAKPVKTSAARGGVDCKDKRFSHPGATVPALLSWAKMALRGLDAIEAREAFRIKVKCDRALKHAGTAYCKAPKNPKTLAALAHVRAICKNAFAKSSARKKHEAAAQKASVADAKAKRKILRFPRSTYRGGGRGALAAAMKRALVAPRLAKSEREILRVQPMGRWAKGRYRRTHVAYQQVMGTVLWWDKDKDGVCRFVSYNFVKERRHGRWTKLRVKSFCMGCPEGWTRCK